VRELGQTHSTRHLSSFASQVAFVIFIILLVWAPLPLGSNRPWAVSLLAIGFCSLLVLVLGTQLAQTAHTGEAPLGLKRWKIARWPLLALMAYALLVVLQCIPFPQSFLSFMGVEDSPGTISVAPFHTRQYLLVTLCLTAAFALGCWLLDTPQRIRWLVLILIGSGVFQAFLAILLYSARAEYELLFLSIRAGYRAMGTFANPNHLAGYMEMCLSVGVGWMMTQFDGSRVSPRGWRQKLFVFLNFVMSRTMWVRMLLVVMVIALVLTRSRMGNIAFFVSMLITAITCAVISKKMRKAALGLVVSLLIVDVVVIGHWVGLERVVQRIESTASSRERKMTEESLEERFQAAQYALKMVIDRPLVGVGGGAFYTAFPQYKGDLLPWFFDHAHNDYVQIAVETGLLGLGLLAAVMLLTLRRVLRLMSDDHPAHVRGIAVGVWMTMWCLMIHSAVDFNLQIPANALTFIVILSLAWALPLRSTESLSLASRSSK
jgi:O-antigen ligase